MPEASDFYRLECLLYFGRDFCTDCAIKHYFEFLGSLRIPLQDPIFGDIMLLELLAKDILDMLIFQM
jgi:hypothetical protein